MPSNNVTSNPSTRNSTGVEPSAFAEYISSSANGESVSISDPHIAFYNTSRINPKHIIKAIGIKPSSPTLFFDLDVGQPFNVITREIHDKYLIYNEMVNELLNADMNEYDKLQEFIAYKQRTFFHRGMTHYHWAIYLTKHGYHYVHEMPRFDYVALALRELNTIFQDNDSIMNLDYLCLRISPKWSITEVDNFMLPLEISFAPILYTHCECQRWKAYHNPDMGDWDIRGEYKNPAQLEMYTTYD